MQWVVLRRPRTVPAARSCLFCDGPDTPRSLYRLGRSPAATKRRNDHVPRRRSRRRVASVAGVRNAMSPSILCVDSACRSLVGSSAGPECHHLAPCPRRGTTASIGTWHVELEVFIVTVWIIVLHDPRSERGSAVRSTATADAEVARSRRCIAAVRVLARRVESDYTHSSKLYGLAPGRHQKPSSHSFGWRSDPSRTAHHRTSPSCAGVASNFAGQPMVRQRRSSVITLVLPPWERTMHDRPGEATR